MGPLQWLPARCGLCRPAASRGVFTNGCERGWLPSRSGKRNGPLAPAAPRDVSPHYPLPTTPPTHPSSATSIPVMRALAALLALGTAAAPGAASRREASRREATPDCPRGPTHPLPRAGSAGVWQCQRHDPVGGGWGGERMPASTV